MKKRMQDELNVKALQRALNGADPDLRICVFEELASTNTYAKQNAVRSANERSLTVAAAQSAGRGRMGRSFYSPSGSGVYFSVATFQKTLPQALTLTAAAAVAVRRAVQELLGVSLGIKWVNDLFWNGKKVCGILCESVALEEGYCVVIGIGVNLKSAVFPEELADIAGTLGADELARADLIAAVYKALLPYLLNSSDTSWLPDYRRYSTVLGREVLWRSGERECAGIAVEIDDEGALLVQSADGALERLSTGEISVKALST